MVTKKPTIGITVTEEKPHEAALPNDDTHAYAQVGDGTVAKQATADKRQRRERGSINPDDIISGAFELAEQVSIDNLSMPLLGKHLGVGVTSIYWYFRKKDDLLNAMTDRA